MRAGAEANRGGPGAEGHDAVLAMNAAAALGAMGDRRATPLLVELLRSADERTRMNAAESLGRIRDPSAVAPLIAALNADDSTAGAAARALGEIGDPAAIDPMAALLFGRGERGGSALLAADALAKIRSPRAVRALVEGTISAGKHGDHTVRARRALDRLLDTHFDSDQEGSADGGRSTDTSLMGNEGVARKIGTRCTPNVNPPPPPPPLRCPPRGAGPA